MAKKNPQYDVVFNYDDLANHLFTELTDLGYAVGKDELLDIADIVFQYMVDLFQLELFDELDEGDVH